jgi:transcriptional antiterminator Rof (Rho-off)
LCLENYKPISCGLHENYQFAVMRRALLELCWREEDGSEKHMILLPQDVFTRQGAEYLEGEGEDGARYLIRLDRIIEAKWVADGRSLDPYV